MAVTHISETEAARDFAGLLARVRAGEEVIIETGTTNIAMHPLPEKKKTLSEAIRRAEERNSTVTLDDQFSRDLEEIIRIHEHEVLRDPWQE